jgi:vacuolar protein sorting-associated protein 45
LRLLSLYALKYEKSSKSELNALKDAFIKRGGVSDLEKEFISKLVSYGGSKFRDSDLFDSQSPIAITKRLIKGLKGIENVYTQHVPLVKNLVEQLINRKLKETSYPYLGQSLKDKPQEIILFIIGGITYEETFGIYNLNKSFNGTNRVIIGGTCLHNFKSFMDEVNTFVGDSNKQTNSSTSSLKNFTTYRDRK